MIAKFARIAIEVVAGVLAVLVLVVSVALWRLSTGPVQLDFLTPRIEKALSDPEAGLSVRIGSTVLTWGGGRRSIDIHTRNVRIRNREGLAVAALPELAIRLSLRALIQGTIAPIIIEVVGARLNLVRGADAGFRLDRDRAGAEAPAADAPTAEADFSQILPAVIEQLMSEPVVDRPFSFLTTFRFMSGRISVDDRKLSRVWEAPLADIELRRDGAGLAGDVALTIDLGETQAKVSGDFLYDRGTERIDLSGGFTGLRAEALVSLVPRLEALAGLTMPLDGSLSASLGLDGAVDSLSFEVAGADGTLDLPDVFAGPLSLREVRLLGRVNGPDRRIDIEAASVQLGTAAQPGPRISGTATLTASADTLGGDLSVAAEAAVTGVSMRGLDRYWPLEVTGGRRWVLRNVPRGAVDEAVVRVDLRIPDGRWGDTEVQRLDGTLRYHDLELHYWRPMPPITGVSGTAVFDHRNFTFSTGGGRLVDLTLGAGTIEIFDLDIAKEAIRLDLDLAGPLRTTLDLLDHERLKLIRRLGIDPAVADGHMAANLKFEFPIYVDPTLDDLEVAATAELERIELRRILFGQDATEGRLALTVDNAGMEARGSLRLGGVPMDVVWSEFFTDTVPFSTRIEAQIARIGDSERRTLGLDLAPYLAGPISADISYTRERSGEAALRAKIDLENASATLPPLSWEKPAGTPGTADLVLRIVGDRIAEFRRIDISAGTLRARGSGRMDKSGRRIVSLALDDLDFGNTHLTGVRADWLGEGVAVRIGGGVLDAVPFLDGDGGPGTRAGGRHPASEGTDSGTALGADGQERRREVGGENGRAPPAGSAVDSQAEPGVRAFAPFALFAPRLDAVTFGPDRFLETVALELRRSRRGWERIGVEALVPRAFWSPERPPDDAARIWRHERERLGEAASDDGDAPRQAPSRSPRPTPTERKFRIDFGPIEDGRYGFSITAADMGAVLRALGRFDTIHGGRVVVAGQSDGPLPGHPIEARIDVQNYVVVDAPALARLLTVASLAGISDLLSGEGIRFDRLLGGFTLDDGVMRTDLIRAYGSALGLTAEGEIDFDTSLTDLRGTLVPAYTVNKILGEIPLLGRLLTGGEGEGLFAVTYRMTGRLAEPDVSVNPLSILTPGFLRGLFSGKGGSAGGEPPRARPERPDR